MEILCFMQQQFYSQTHHSTPHSVHSLPHSRDFLRDNKDYYYSRERDARERFRDSHRGPHRYIARSRKCFVLTNLLKSKINNKIQTANDSI